MDYSEFRITIKDKLHREFKMSADNPAYPFEIDYNPLYTDIIQLFIKWLKDNNDKTRAQEDVKIFGTILFRVIFNPYLEEMFRVEYDKIAKNSFKKLRVILEFDKKAEDLALWPWEYIYLPDIEGPGKGFSGKGYSGKGFFLAADEEIVLTRHVPLTLKEIEKTNTLNILIIKSTPTKSGYEGEEDPRMIVSDDIVNKIEKLEKWGEDKQQGGHKIQIHVDQLTDPTKKKLREKISSDFEKGIKYHIVHFIGHGKYVPANQKEAEGGYLGFTKPDNPEFISWLSDSAFAECFKNREPRLVFLNACQGAMSQSYESFRGMALQLVFSRISAVIAMQYPVTNKVAIQFANKFYDSLCEGKDIDVAVQEGRMEIGWYSDEAENFTNRDFGSPVVYLQKEDGLIIASSDVHNGGEIEKLVCPKCRNEVLENQKLCLECRTELIPCPNCGKPFSINAGICIWCKYDLKKESSSNRESDPSKRIELSERIAPAAPDETLKIAKDESASQRESEISGRRSPSTSEETLNKRKSQNNISAGSLEKLNE